MPSAASTASPVISPMRVASGGAAAALIDQIVAALRTISQRVIVTCLLASCLRYPTRPGSGVHRCRVASQTIRGERDAEHAGSHDHERLYVPANARLNDEDGGENEGRRNVENGAAAEHECRGGNRRRRGGGPTTY